MIILEKRNLGRIRLEGMSGLDICPIRIQIQLILKVHVLYSLYQNLQYQVYCIARD